MSRLLHTLSTFGFAAAAGVALLVVHPWQVAVPVALSLLFLCFALQALREVSVAGEVAAELRRGR